MKNSKIAAFLRVWEWRVLVLLIYAMPLHEASKNTLWGILLALSISRWVLEKTCPCTGVLGLATLAWLFAGVWASFFAIEPYSSWKGFWDMARAGALLWIVASSAREDRLRSRLLDHLVMAAAAASLLAWVDYAGAIRDPSKFAPHVRVQVRSIGHFNQSGIYLAMSWMIALAALIRGRQIFSRPWVGRLALALIGLALLGTTARTAIAVAGLGSLIVLWRFQSSRWIARWLMAGGAVVLLALAGSANLRNRVFYGGSLKDRVFFWRSAWDAAQTRPWTGVGLNNFKNIHLLNPEPLKMGSIDHAHNLYVNSFTQMGIPGGIALLGLLAAAASAAWNSRFRTSESEIFFYAAGGVWWVIAATGLGNTTLHHEMSMLFFMTLALVTALPNAPSSGYFRSGG